jgi:hypothetical protein
MDGKSRIDFRGWFLSDIIPDSCDLLSHIPTLDAI